jgi:hypothetical protein
LGKKYNFRFPIWLEINDKKTKILLAFLLASSKYPFLYRTRKTNNFIMKKLVFVFFTGIFLMSCSKEDVSTPGAANQNVFFKSANVEVENLQVSQVSSNTVTVNFSTVYENNIKRIELMSGASTNTFCTIQGINSDSNSQTLKKYSFQDTNVKGDTMYYLLRFEDSLGNWTYTGYYTTKIN